MFDEEKEQDTLGSEASEKEKEAGSESSEDKGTETKEETIETEEQEEMIPVSKVQPRFDEMTARLKKLEAENEQYKSTLLQSHANTGTPQYTDEELNYIVDNSDQYEPKDVRWAKTEIRKRERESIRKEILNEVQAPVKQQQEVATWFNQAVSELGNELLDINSPLRQKAEQIYASDPKYQATPQGQYMAAQRAFIELNKGSNKKVKTLKKRLTKEQSKTQLNSSSRSASTTTSGSTRNAKLAKLEAEAVKAGKGSKEMTAYLRELSKAE